MVRGDPADQQVQNSGKALAVALLGFFVITLDALVVNLALPVIEKDLGSSITGLLWIVDGYTLMFAALLLFAGTLADRIGARRAFGVGLAIFVVASAACALAPNLASLIVARFAQGAGAAVMLPASLALIRESYSDPKRRARAIGIWAIGGAVASAAGPAVGGLVSLLSWRMIFFINLPVGMVAFVLLLAVRRSPRRDVPFDWIGQLTAIVAMSALIYGLIEGGEAGFGSPLILVAFAVSTVALGSFLLSQWRGTHPMVPLELFRSRPVVISVAVGFAFMVSFYGLVFLLSLYFQQVRGLSVLEAGLAFLPMTALSVLVNPMAARIAERFGQYLCIAVGLVLMAIGLISIYLAVSQAQVLIIALLTIPIGVGGALAIPTVTALLINSVRDDRVGIASGVLNTCRQLGGALAVALFGTLVGHGRSFVDGMQISLLIAIAVLLVTAAASYLLRPQNL